MKYHIKTLTWTVCLGAIVFLSASCKKDDDKKTDENDTDTVVNVTDTTPTAWKPRRYVDKNRTESPLIDKRGLSVDKDAEKMYIHPEEILNDTTNMAQPITADDDLVSEAINIGGSGDLKLTLLWDFKADIDIHVEQPDGTLINYMRKRDSRSGGFLDVDNLVGGSGSAENIYWETPPRGRYKVWVHYFGPSQRDGSTGSGPVHVVLLKKGEEPKTFETRLSRPGDNSFITTFEI